MSQVVLDTCVLIFLTERARLKPAAVEILKDVADGGVTYISPVSAWEVGMLVSLGRLQLSITPERWFAALFEAPNVKLADMPPNLMIASSFLPGKPPRDPFDRIIAATARDLGATLITRDRALLAYGEQRHVSVVEC